MTCEKIESVAFKVKSPLTHGVVAFAQEKAEKRMRRLRGNGWTCIGRYQRSHYIAPFETERWLFFDFCFVK